MTFFHCICVALLFFTTKAQARVIFEPYAGYASPSSISNVGKATDTYQAWGLGARLTKRFSRGFFLGLDGSYLRSLSYTKGDLSQIDITNPYFYRGAFVVGGHLLRSLRIWVGYQFLDQMYLPGTSSSLNEGTSYKAGVGVRLKKNLSFNGEYFVGKYTQGYAALLASQNGASNPLSKVFFFSVSTPFAL